jgi:protein SCO1
MRHSGQTSVPPPLQLRSSRAAAAVCLICCLLAPAPVRGDWQVNERPPRPAVDPGRRQQPRPNQSDERSSQKERQVIRTPIPDLTLLDQDGGKIHFYSDLVKGKVVVINFVYTSCTAICPMMGKSFSGVQNLAGDRAGKDFHLISVTTDPETDTPKRLRAWGAKFGARPGWTLVTGEKSEIDQLLRALLGESAGKGVHTPIVLIGNDSRGTWTSSSGLTSPSNLMKVIDAAMSK